MYFDSQAKAAYYEIQTSPTSPAAWVTHSTPTPIAGDLQKHPLYGVGPGEVVVRARALDANKKPITAWSNVDSSMPDASGTPQQPPTSLIDKLRKSYAEATPGKWVATDAIHAGAENIADFKTAADGRFIETAKECTDELLTLYDVAKAIHGRAVLGATYLRAAERKQLEAIMRALG